MANKKPWSCYANIMQSLNNLAETSTMRCHFLNMINNFIHIYVSKYSPSHPDRVKIMNPKYFIVLKQPDFQWRNASRKINYFHMDLIRHQKFQEKRNPFHGLFTFSPFQLDFGLQNWWTFEEGRRGNAALAARAFKVWKSLRNKVVLPVKRISYFFHFSLLCVVYWLQNQSSKLFEKSTFEPFCFKIG